MIFLISLLLIRGGYWLPDEVFELAALAQHYGLMTRLIDWTQNVQIALHFAAFGNMKSKTKADSFSVWAINAEWLQELKKFQLKDIGMISRTLKTKGISEDERWINEAYDNSLPLRFCLPHYALNPNLCAQKGVLTLWQHNIISNLSNSMSPKLFGDPIGFNNLVRCKFKEFMDAPPKEEPLDELLEDYLDSQDNKKHVEEFLYNNPLSDKNLMYHFIIPSSCAEHLIGILRHQYYGIEKIFPGYKGAAEAVKDDFGL